MNLKNMNNAHKGLPSSLAILTTAAGAIGIVMTLKFARSKIKPDYIYCICVAIAFVTILSLIAIGLEFAKKTPDYNQDESELQCDGKAVLAPTPSSSIRSQPNTHSTSTNNSYTFSYSGNNLNQNEVASREGREMWRISGPPAMPYSVNTKKAIGGPLLSTDSIDLGGHKNHVGLSEQELLGTTEISRSFDISNFPYPSLTPLPEELANTSMPSPPECTIAYGLRGGLLQEGLDLPPREVVLNGDNKLAILDNSSTGAGIYKSEQQEFYTNRAEQQTPDSAVLLNTSTPLGAPSTKLPFSSPPQGTVYHGWDDDLQARPMSSSDYSHGGAGMSGSFCSFSCNCCVEDDGKQCSNESHCTNCHMGTSQLEPLPEVTECDSTPTTFTIEEDNQEANPTNIHEEVATSCIDGFVEITKEENREKHNFVLVAHPDTIVVEQLTKNGQQL